MPSTEREKMLASEPYLASDPELVRARDRARLLIARFNAIPADQRAERLEILRELQGRLGQDIEIESPFFCVYGAQLSLGDAVRVDVNCVIRDCQRVEIGQATRLGPGVLIETALHPTDPTERHRGVEMARPVKIGVNVWIGGGSIIGPGVEIGDNVVIGAGSIVNQSLPGGVVAIGNPCQVIRNLDEHRISTRPPLP